MNEKHDPKTWQKDIDKVVRTKRSSEEYYAEIESLSNYLAQEFEAKDARIAELEDALREIVDMSGVSSMDAGGHARDIAEQALKGGK